MPKDPGLRLPRLEAARSWLDKDAMSSIPAAETVTVVEARATQREDGSWGAADDPRSRVLPTLWIAKLLTELGLGDDDELWSSAAHFMATHAHAGDGVFSVDGTDGGVLSCYVGIAGEMYALGGRHDLAAPQVEWIARFQDVRLAGDVRRDPEADVWDARLRTRYGGCMASTTCLIGLVKAARALRRWLDHEANDRVSKLLATIREVLLERRLMYAGDGAVIPLGGSGGQAERWLEPTYPLDWHTDLIEVLDLVTHSGPPDPRMRPAVDHLVDLQLPDGSWPLRASFPPAGVPPPARRSRGRGSRFVTARVIAALAPLAIEG